MTTDLTPPQRYELKYLIDETTATAMRDVLKDYLSLDDFSRNQPHDSYANHSLYLDSTNWQYFWDTVAGNPRRHKLRVRFYDDDPAGTVYLEIKRRSGDLITKQRAAVTREEAVAVLRGQDLVANRQVGECQARAPVIQDFRKLMKADQAVPRLHLAYHREAWLDASEPAIRFTMDRGICCAYQASCDLSSALHDPLMPWGSQVIASLKFAGRFPAWFWQLQHRFNLQPCNPAKYATSVSTLEKRSHPTGIGYPGTLANMMRQLSLSVHRLEPVQPSLHGP